MRLPIRLRLDTFSPGDVAEAAQLRAARHRANRLILPRLPVAFEQPDVMYTAMARAASWSSTSGVTARVGDRLVGYLLGSRREIEPASIEALGLPPRIAVISASGHAVEPGRAYELYGTMYAALAESWQRQGFPTHYVDVNAAEDETIQAWFELGFGCDLVTAARDTTRFPGAGLGGGIDVRRATIDDLDVVVRLAWALERYQSSAPMFRPYCEPAQPGLRDLLAQCLSDTSIPVWLAVRGDRAVGLVGVHSEVVLDPVTKPERSAVLWRGFIDEEARGAGVALAKEAFRWARAAGYETCVASWQSANLLSARVLRAADFRPLQYRLRRSIEDG